MHHPTSPLTGLRAATLLALSGCDKPTAPDADAPDPDASDELVRGGHERSGEDRMPRLAATSDHVRCAKDENDIDP